MERIIMKYVNKDKDYCLLIGGDDVDDIYVMNLDEMHVYKLSPMGSLFDVLEDIDFDEDDVYVNKNEVDGLKEFLKENADEIDSRLMFDLLEHMVAE